MLVNTEEWAKKNAPKPSFIARVSWLVYKRTGLKLHYHMPPRGMVSNLFIKHHCVSHIEVDFLENGTERIWLRR